MSDRIVEPEVAQLSDFLLAFNKEGDRGAALVAAAMLDERLENILSAFFIDSAPARDLLTGFSAPLGTFSARASAAAALGLIQENEFQEITLVRKIRNEFGHAWSSLSFESGTVATLAKRMPWLGPKELEATASNRSRFNFAVSILLTDLIWRVRLVKAERRAFRTWSNKSRGP